MFQPHRLLLPLALVLAAFLVGCADWPRRAAEPDAAATTPEVPPAASESAVVAPGPDREAVEADVRQLLRDAERALAADQLTTPLHDNAFDRFQAVLLLRPGNEQAQTGLQLIFTRYVALVRDALARNQPGTARALLERARLVDRDNPQLAELAARISSVQERLTRRGDVAEDKEIPLDAAGLDRRDPALIRQLQALAERVRASEESLLIVARSDAEGRWIYQRMSEGVPGYRLRGDIRLGREPRILLLPPID